MENNTASADMNSQRIDLLHETDVAYWCRILNVSPEQLRIAVQHAGPKAVEVQHYLKANGYTGTV